jgi:hypothetical protein
MTKARDIATSEVVTGEIGETIQAHDDDLDSIAALDKTDGNVIVGDGTNWVAESGATARTSLGLGSAATTDSTDYATAAQGALASTALQPTGDGSSLTGIAGGFSNMQVFNSPGTFDSTNVAKAKVTVVAGGGGAGKPYGKFLQGGGGGGGGAAIKIVDLTGVNSVAVTRGNPGSAGTQHYLQAGSGGTSSFGAYCSATGGTGAQGGSTTYAYGQAGKGGNGSGGDLNIMGGGGGTAYDYSPSMPAGNGGGAAGGNSLFAGGGAAGSEPGRPVTVNATAGTNGGGGGCNAANAMAGGAGVVIVEY